MPTEVPEVDIDECEKRRATGVTLLDVREVDEWEQARIPGVVHIPMSELVDRLDDVPDGELLVVCAVGGRSATVTAFLRERGIDATNVDGGTNAWIASGRPVEGTSAQ